MGARAKEIPHMERGPALLCTEGMLAGQRFVITAEGLRIGREAGNEVHIDDTGVSRQHARVLLHNGAVWVQDAGSRNGIFVNGERVPDHKQMKVGDKLAVGAHAFEVVPPAAAPAARPAAPAPAPARPSASKPAPAAAPRWKIWPFVVAVLLALGFIGCIGAFGALRGGDGAATAPATGQPTYSLTTLIEPGQAAPAGTAAAPGDAPAPTVAQALAVVAGADPTGALAAVPDAPPGTTARQLLETAQTNYDGGRLADARVQYQQALKLDPTCEICTVRIERIQTELAAKVQTSFDAGMRAYDAKQFSQAISAWETVLMLVPDKADPMHLRAAEYLQKARTEAGGR
jgi:hypothetical protein